MLADGRKSDSDIARRIGSTKKEVKKNYSELEKSGIITGSTIHMNYKIFGFKAVAYILITVDSQQAERLFEYLDGRPEVFAAFNRGIKGHIDMVVTLKTLEQLNKITDSIKSKFSISDIKTAIWTDVRETNVKLAITDENKKIAEESYFIKAEKKPKSFVIDEIDQKIADKLAENGRISMDTLGKEIGISSDTAKRRYERLKKNGALKVTIQVNPNKIGFRAMCIFFAVISNETSMNIIEEISKIPDVISIMKTAGNYDLQIWAMVQNLDELLSIQEAIEKTQGISRIDLEILRLERWKKWPSPKQYISTF